MVVAQRREGQTLEVGSATWGRRYSLLCAGLRSTPAATVRPSGCQFREAVVRRGA